MPTRYKCKRCEWEWEYNGKKKSKSYTQYISCPRCHTLVPLMKQNETT